MQSVKAQMLECWTYGSKTTESCWKSKRHMPQYNT